LLQKSSNKRQDIFVHDREAHQTSRISITSNRTEANDFSERPSISFDGRYIAFRSGATNLVPNDTNGTIDIFVHDRQAGETNRVSVTSDGFQGNSTSSAPDISSNGQYVVFESSATNFVSNDTNEAIDIFVHDRQSGRTSRVSTASDGTQANGDSPLASISAGGRYIAFTSYATNLVIGDTNSQADVFLHDRNTGRTTQVSITPNGASSNAGGGQQSISANGRYVAFSSLSTNIVSGGNTGTVNYHAYIQDRSNTELDPLPTPDTQFFISGRVTDHEGNPIPNVIISANFFGSATTNSDGKYLLSSLEPRTYTLTPVLPNYEFLPNTRTITVPPSSVNQDFVVSGKPVIVFVHGWNGFPPQFSGCDASYKFRRTDDQFSDSYFKNIDDYFKQDYAVFYAHLISWPCWTPTINENVQYLREAIEDAKNKTGRSKVTLIAHSMGGIISRAYVEGPNYRNREDVEQLFTLGSFHQGVPVEKMLEGLLGPVYGFLGLGAYCLQYQPAVCDFSINGMSYFNQKYSMRAPSVIYHMISGDAPFFARNALGKVMALKIPGADDGIVPTVSGVNLQQTSGPNQSRVDYITTDEVHHTVFGNNSYFTRTLTNGSQSYFDCLNPILGYKTKQNCGKDTVIQSTTQELVDLNEQTPNEYGRLITSQPVARTIILEGGPAAFIAQWDSGLVKFSLINPSNQVIDPQYAIIHSDIVVYSSDINAATYYIPNATSGTWKLVLQAGSEIPTAGITYTTFVAVKSSLKLITGIDRKWYSPGTTAVITASLTTLPRNLTITASILDPHNTVQAIQLIELDNGRYQGVYYVPDVAGYADVRLVAKGVTTEGIPFERGDVLSFQISPRSAQLTGVYSEIVQPRFPGSSFYKSLDVTIGVKIFTNDTLGLSADLVDSAGGIVAHSFAVQDFTVQNNIINLQFDGLDINSSRKNGPYMLTNLLLTAQNEATLVVEEAKNVYLTAAYSYNLFGSGNIYLPLIHNK